MTACAEWKDRLLDFALGAPASAELEAHLLRCGACATELQAMRANSEQLDATLRALVQGAEPSPAFRARLAASLEASTSRRAGWPWPARFAVAACLLALVVLAGLMAPRISKQLKSNDSNQAITTVASLSEWRSPTQTLLRGSGDQYLRSTPRLQDFYFQLSSASRPRGAGTEKKGPTQP